MRLRFASSSKEKKKKHLGETALMKWNPWTPFLTFLVLRIIVNDNFLFLYRNPASSLSPLTKKKKKLNNKENELWYQN